MSSEPFDDDSGTPWIPDPAERDALRADLEWALAQDAKLMAHHFKTKRQVNYNPEATLCPFCTKRIRLNNSGRMRTHVSGKARSARCMGSDQDPTPFQLPLGLDENKVSPDSPPVPEDFIKKEDPPTALFSDL